VRLRSTCCGNWFSTHRTYTCLCLCLSIYQSQNRWYDMVLLPLLPLLFLILAFLDRYRYRAHICICSKIKSNQRKGSDWGWNSCPTNQPNLIKYKAGSGAGVVVWIHEIVMMTWTQRLFANPRVSSER